MNQFNNLSIRFYMTLGLKVRFARSQYYVVVRQNIYKLLIVIRVDYKGLVQVVVQLACTTKNNRNIFIFFSIGGNTNRTIIPVTTGLILKTVRYIRRRQDNYIQFTTTSSIQSNNTDPPVTKINTYKIRYPNRGSSAVQILSQESKFKK